MMRLLSNRRNCPATWPISVQVPALNTRDLSVPELGVAELSMAFGSVTTKYLFPRYRVSLTTKEHDSDG